MLSLITCSSTLLGDVLVIFLISVIVERKNAVKLPSIFVFMISTIIISLKRIYGLMDEDILLEDINRELVHHKHDAHKYVKRQLFKDTMDRKILISCYA